MTNPPDSTPEPLPESVVVAITEACAEAKARGFLTMPTIAIVDAPERNPADELQLLDFQLLTPARPRRAKRQSVKSRVKEVQAAGLDVKDIEFRPDGSMKFSTAAASAVTPMEDLEELI
jgi:hypothetical protein